MDSSLEARKIVFGYGENRVLNGLSLEIAPGDFVCILGPNGSGKSTLLKNLTAEYLPEEGTILVESRDLMGIRRKDLARTMAVVPQETVVNFGFTVHETVLMSRIPHLKRFESEGPRDLQLVREAMEKTQVWDLRDRLINELSGGERQRVILARALAQEPRILLLDEPTSNLDLRHQFELLELVEQLNRIRNLTVLAVLHDLNLAARFAGKIILMDRGHVVGAGTPKEILTSDTIRRVYQVETSVTENEITGKLNIIALGGKRRCSPQSREKKVHLVCGGGSGVFLMEQLCRQGYPVSCGVLNAGDSDWKMARELGLKMAEEAPYSPVSAGALEENRLLMEAADLTVLMQVPFGPGNLAGLRQLCRHSEAGFPVLVVDPGPVESWDYTGGEAARLLQDLLAAGAVLVPRAGQVLDYLE